MPRSTDLSDGSTSVSNSVTTDLETSKDVDPVFACLANRRRRLLLEYLSERSGPVVVETLVRFIREREGRPPSGISSDDQPGDITVTLIHNHLPKMSEVGVVEVDHDARMVRKGDRFETAEALLREV